MFRVASLQLEIIDGQNKEERIAYALGQMEQARGADLILLPETWNIGYFSFERYREECETLDGPTLSAVAAKARELNAFVFAGSFVERRAGNLYNTSVLLDNKGEMLAVYRKIHLFGYGSREQELITPGREITVVPTELGVLGLSTCYDLRFPELYRRLLEKGAEIFLVTSAWPYPRLNAWVVLNQARALENLCYLVSCNCAGENRGARYLGLSMVVDPWGEILAGKLAGEQIVRAELDISRVHGIRNEFPPLQDRTPEITGK